MPAASPAIAIEGLWTLPPLILHPFSGEDTADQLLEGSRASLMLNGLLPCGSGERDRLATSVARARLQELRMLFFLGKDVSRWIEQSMDFVDRTQELRTSGIRPQSFSALLVEDPPTALSEKLHIWGVTDQKSVFSRAIGITAAFAEPPGAEMLSPGFILNYHRFLDYLYVCYQNLEPFTELRSRNFEVALYASSEYSQMLSDQWAKDI